MKQSNSSGCAVLAVGFVLLLIAVPIVRWIVQHAASVAALALLVAIVLVVAVNYSKRSERERAQRRAAASLRVESARTGIERRLTIAQEFMRLAAEALEALPVDAEPQPWNQRLADLEVAASQLRLSAYDPLGERLPDPAARDRLDAASLRQALDALWDFLRAARAPKPKDWQEEPERLRLLRRERTRLLVEQDTIARRVQQ